MADDSNPFAAPEAVVADPAPPAAPAAEEQAPPPPYESVVMQQTQNLDFNPESLGVTMTTNPSFEGAAPAGGAPAAGADGEFAIQVCDPVEQGKGIGAYVSYRVQTRTTLPQYEKSEIEVIRRFRDFSWLHDRLQEKHRGVVVPPLPEKDVVQKFQMSADFIERRARGLNSFINRVASHPQLKMSPDLQLFLEATEPVWAFEVARSNAEQGTLRKTLNSAKQALKGFQASAMRLGTGKSAMEEEDTEYLQVKKYILALDGHLNEVYRHSARVIERQAKLSASTMEFGKAMRELGDTETGALQDSFLSMADTAEEQGDKAREHVLDMQVRFVEPMKEYARFTTSLKHVVTDRSNALTSWGNRKNDVEAKKAKLAKYRTTPGIPEMKVSDAEQELNLARMKCEAAMEAYQSIKEVMKTEIGRFNSVRVVDLHRILQDFAEAQSAAAKAQAAAWAELSPKLHL